jgi:phosphoribosylanthranilate isomerase
MKFTENRQQVEKLDVDFLGFIFYAPSKRYIGQTPELGLFQTEKPKVGVFVDESAFEIMGLAKNLGLEWVQLHGKEKPQTCQMLKNQGLKIIKVFNVDDNFDFASTKPYAKVANFFLFDTKTMEHGGSGKKFNWKILEKYEGHTPFFLSGGIGPGDVESIKNFNHPKLTGVDLNSGFEDEPGVKNIEKLRSFVTKINEK